MEHMWTVEQGEYSGHRIMCVCRTKTEAERIVAAYNGSELWHYSQAYVGTVPLVVGEPEPIVTYELQATMWDTGEVEEDHEPNTRVEWEFDMMYPAYAVAVGWRWVRAPIHGGKGGRLEVYGTDAERVRKTFSDMKARVQADDVLRRRSEARSR